MSDSSSLTFLQKAILVSFAGAMVALSAHQLVKSSAQKNKSGSLEARTKQLLNELSGNIDVAKASISSEYFRETVPGDKLLPSTSSPESLTIRRSIKEGMGTSVDKVIKSTDEKK